jgi:hypothetical protein
MTFPLVRPVCSKGTVFNWGGAGFEVLSAEYSKAKHLLTLTLKEVAHVEGYKEPDTAWLIELGRAYAEGLPIDNPGPPLWWKEIEMHTFAVPPSILFWRERSDFLQALDM